MEQSLADVLRHAFEEASGPCFHEADLNFENVYFEEETSTIFSENAPTKEKESLHQEAPAFCYGEVTNTAEEAEEEQPDEAAFQAEGVVNTGGSQEGRDASSWQDSAQKGEDEEDEGEEVEPGKRLLLAYTGDEHSSSQGDGARPSGERRPLTPEEDENTPVRSKEPGETESDEISYFQRVPEQDSRTERTEEDQLETHGSESEALKREEEEEEEEEEQEEDEYDDGNNHEGEEEEEDEALTSCCQREVENPHWDKAAGDILDFLELKVQHLQDLLADDEEPVEKMKDFSGEDHQEAGESFAEYPSDFSSCEYIEREERDEESNGRCAGDPGTVRRATGSETLVVGNRETQRGKAELVETMSGDTPALRCEASDSDSSSDEEPRETLEDLENQLDEQHCGGRDHRLDDKEVPEVALCPAGSRGFSSGSLDDSFFSTAERQNPQISELEEEEEDECEESSNWEQEQERIRAFNEFDEDSDQLTGQEGRQTKVQFSTELFSQVILYEIDSSDRDSLSSSTDEEEEEEEEELSSEETPEEPKEPDERAEIRPSDDAPNTQAESVSHLNQTPKKKQQRCLAMLKVTLTMGVMAVTGLLMLWWATDQAGWLSRGTFY